MIAQFQVRPTLEEEVVKWEDPVAKEFKCKRKIDYAFRNDGTLLKERRICVPHSKALKESILEEAHSSAYAMHPECTKMYITLKAYYWWPSMRWEIVEFVVKCLICQQVKLQCQKTGVLLCPLPNLK